MSWGVATQNGVSVSLASIVSLSCGATEFSPASLFTSGVAGAWYDPSDVLLNWRTNLEVQTEDFSTTYCLHQGINYAANQVASPTGTITADLITENTAPSTDHRLGRYAVSLSINNGATYTGSVYVKRASGSRNVILRIDLGSGNFGTSGVNFDLTNLTVNPTAGQSGTITDAGNGWYRLSITATSSLTYTPNYSLSVILSNGTSPLNINYTGDGTSGLYIWGAQLELGSTATTYQAITTPEQTYLLYDPQPVLYQDSAGTTPVTAVEQPVGLMLDKSQGGLGPELVTNGGFSSSSNWTLSSTTITGGNLVFGVAFGYASQAVSGTAGNYKLFVNKSAGFAGAGNLTFAFYNAGSIVGSAISIGSATLTFGSGIVTASGSFDEIRIACSTTDAYQVDSISLARAPGNHASQATAASRPVLRARYNLLTYSEQFDNAAWTKTSVTVSANQATAPDGTLTADLLYPTTSGTARTISRDTLGQITGTVFTTAIKLKAAGIGFAYIYNVQGNQFFYVNLSTGATSSVGSNISNISSVVDANGWVTITFNSTLNVGTTASFFVGPCDAAGSQTVTTSGTNGIYIWGADLRTGSSAGTYQRIAAATDYATAGFLPYLYFVTDDSFGTNSINFSATDKMSVCAGVTKLSDAGGAIFAELSADTNSNNGAFSLAVPGSATDRYTWVSRGTSLAFVTTTSSSYNAPITNVVTGLGDISGDSTILRINGTQIATSPTDQGTGNFGTYPLYIGRRNNATIPFNGNFYQLVVCGKTLSASELASTEAYVATKTGVTI